MLAFLEREKMILFAIGHVEGFLGGIRLSRLTGEFAGEIAFLTAAQAVISYLTPWLLLVSQVSIAYLPAVDTLHRRYPFAHSCDHAESGYILYIKQES
ncbi:hypothetical protein PM082_019646 [Marasmius tenuissimus]|nr:hypothetical protein PM082_019646 [Marasmius tenuissimus]